MLSGSNFHFSQVKDVYPSSCFCFSQNVLAAIFGFFSNISTMMTMTTTTKMIIIKNDNNNITVTQFTLTNAWLTLYHHNNRENCVISANDNYSLLLKLQKNHQNRSISTCLVSAITNIISWQIVTK